MCPHAEAGAVYAHQKPLKLLYVSSYYYICILILYICILILYVSSY